MGMTATPQLHHQWRHAYLFQTVNERQFENPEVITDDLTLMMEIQKSEEGEAAQKLDEDLERLHNWGDQLLLELV